MSVSDNTSQSTVAQAMLIADAYARGMASEYIRVPEFLLDAGLTAGPALLYGVISKYFSIGQKTGKGAFPSRALLAEECNANQDTIGEWMKKLAAGGWVTWRQRPGTSSIFILWGPDADGNGAGLNMPDELVEAMIGASVRNTGNPSPTPRNFRDDHDKPNTMNNRNTPSNPPTPQGNEDGGMDAGDYEDVGPMIPESSGPAQHHPQQAPVRQPQPERPMPQRAAPPTEDGPYRTLEDEQRHPFWTPQNLATYKALTEPYPPQKRGEEKLAMHAWRTYMPEYLTDQAGIDRWWNGLHDWKHKWAAERTEDTYIPWLANFLKNKKWQDAPRVQGR